jgi:hypothetical protein
MERITRGQVEGIFKHFIKAIGGEVGAFTVGKYYLDYNGVYGGYVVNKIVNKGGGVSCPFGHNRHKAAAMWDILRFAIDAIEEKERIK